MLTKLTPSHVFEREYLDAPEDQHTTGEVVSLPTGIAPPLKKSVSSFFTTRDGLFVSPQLKLLPVRGHRRYEQYTISEWMTDPDLRQAMAQRPLVATGAIGGLLKAQLDGREGVLPTDGRLALFYRPWTIIGIFRRPGGKSWSVYDFVPAKNERFDPGHIAFCGVRRGPP